MEVYNGHLGGLRPSLIYRGKLLSRVLGGSLGGSWGVLGAPWGSLGGPWGAWGLLGSHTLVTPEEVGGYNIILHQRETPNSFFWGDQFWR